ncbi:MAG: hypothetical protein N3D85_04955 [Candidatus Bathyarchaeota archaeon]|nr:hypothetical protein [Candidatus Bathyarchaeota archaeon]
MRLIKNTKGQIRVIEAFFAAVLLLSSLTIIPMTQKVPSYPNEETDVLSSVAYRTLVSLDAEGEIGELVANRNWSAIKTLLQSCLSPVLWFNVTIFDQNFACLNDQLICSGGLISDRIYAADYVCTRTNATYAVYVMRLQLATVN